MFNGKIKNIIFDFDGTLADTAPLSITTMQTTITVLNLPFKNEAECKRTIGLRLEDVPGMLWPDSNVSGKEFATAYRRIFDRLKRPLKVKCYPGVIETLLALKCRGFNLAIASSRSHASLEEYCIHFGLTSIFSIIVGGDDVISGKPSPEPVLKICSEMKWAPNETLTVGDAVVDIEMGRSADTFTCAVTYGNQSAEQLNTANPDFTIFHFSALSQL